VTDRQTDQQTNYATPSMPHTYLSTAMRLIDIGDQLVHYLLQAPSFAQNDAS